MPFEDQEGVCSGGRCLLLATLVRIMLFPLCAPQRAITLGNIECATHPWQWLVNISMRGGEWGQRPPPSLGCACWGTSMQLGCRADVDWNAVVGQHNARRRHLSPHLHLITLSLPVGLKSPSYLPRPPILLLVGAFSLGPHCGHRIAFNGLALIKRRWCIGGVGRSLVVCLPAYVPSASPRRVLSECLQDRQEGKLGERSPNVAFLHVPLSLAECSPNARRLPSCLARAMASIEYALSRGHVAHGVPWDCHSKIKKGFVAAGVACCSPP